MDSKEPTLEGSLRGGMSKSWVEWYRAQGYSLLEAREEALRRLELKRDKAAELASNKPEPSLLNIHGRKNPEWVRWYRDKNGVTLLEALNAQVSRISQLNKQ
jgi:hypothetical protein